MTIFIKILLTSLVVSLISFAGAFLLLFKKTLSDRSTKYLVSFAAGVMLSTAFLNLLPEAWEKNQQGNIFVPLLAGVVVFFFMERYLLWFHHHDSTHNIKPSAHLILLGDGFHNFFDGIAIAAAFLTNPALGVTTAIAIAAHEIPQEIADLGILIHGGMERSKALLYNFISALAALVGAVLGYFFLSTLEHLLPTFISFTAGMFIYIACSDLIPELHKDSHKTSNFTQSALFIIGIVAMYFLSTFITH